MIYKLDPISGKINSFCGSVTWGRGGVNGKWWRKVTSTLSKFLLILNKVLIKQSYRRHLAARRQSCMFISSFIFVIHNVLTQSWISAGSFFKSPFSSLAKIVLALSGKALEKSFINSAWEDEVYYIWRVIWFCLRVWTKHKFPFS